MKVELEDLAFQYLDPTEHDQLLARLAETAGSRESYITEVVERLKTVLAEGEIKAQVYGRAKHLWSIYQKMKKTGRDVEQIYDVLAFRVITESVRDCYAVLGVVHSNWTPVPGRFKDFIALPKPNLYQSLHTTVIGPRAERMEVQIRTQEMHRIAEQGIAAHWKYKEQKTPRRRGRQGLRLAAPADGVAARSEGPDRVHRDGEDRSVPGRGLRLHAEGRRQGAPQGVDADPSRLRHPLPGRRALLGRPGERPHRSAALCAPQRRHGRDPRLGRTRSRPRTGSSSSSPAAPAPDPTLHPDGAARAQRPDGARSAGARAAQAGLRRSPRPSATGCWTRRPQRLRLGTADELLVAIGYGRVSPGHAADAVLVDRVARLSPRRAGGRGSGRRPPPVLKRSIGGIKVQGEADILVKFAKCCTPVPGDSIVGFISRGHGVVIHTRDCPKALDLDPLRRVDVSWDDESKAVRPVAVQVTCSDRPASWPPSPSPSPSTG